MNTKPWRDEYCPPSNSHLKEIAELRKRVQELEELAAIGRAWRENSSLERWFPITAEQIQLDKNRITELEDQAAEQSRNDGLRVQRLVERNKELEAQLNVSKPKP